MLQVSLFVEDEKLDLFEGDSLSINLSLQDIKDISKVFTEYTKSFSIPASKTNNRIFKHYYNSNITDGFDARTKSDSKIEINNIPFRKGKLKLDSIEIRDNKPFAYKVTFFGKIVNLADLFGDDKLGDMPTNFFTQFDQVYTATTVKSSLDTAITVGSFSNAIVTPLISNTTRLFYDSNTNFGDYQSNGQINKLGGNLFAHTGGGVHHHSGVYYEELKYAIRLHIVVKAIEDAYGLTFSNDFLNTTNEHYHGLYMWLHRSSGYAFDSDEVTTLVNTFNTETDTNLGYTVTCDGSTFTAKDITTFLRPTNITVSLNTTSNNEYTIVLTKNGVSVQEETISASASPKTATTTFNETIVTFGGSGNTSGTQYQVLVKSRSQITFNSNSNSFVKFVSTDFSGQNLTTTQTDLASNMVVTNARKFIIKDNLPEIGVLDFLTSLFKMFNLTAFEEEDGTIKVQTLDQFYRSSIKTWDLDRYLDSNFTVQPALPFSEVKFGFEGLETFLADDHKNRFGKEWGTEEYKFNNYQTNIYDAVKGTYEVKPNFEHMKFERLLDYDGTRTDVQVGWCADSGESAYVGKPILFYVKRLSSATTIRVLNTAEGNDYTDITAYNIPLNSQDTSASASTNNINFSQEQNEYSAIDNNVFPNTLFRVFYSAYIKKVFDSSNRITKVNGFLPIQFILNHSLADKIFYRNDKYLINKINVNINNGKASMELIKDIKVANELLISDSQTSDTNACAVSDANLTTKVYYDLDILFGDSAVTGTILYINESLTERFIGDGGFYKIKGFNQSVNISSTGIVSNVASC